MIFIYIIIKCTYDRKNYITNSIQCTSRQKIKIKVKKKKKKEKKQKKQNLSRR